jgi:mRNA interferase HigB
MFGASVDFVDDSRIVFDVGGNKFRLVARVVYGPYYRVMIKFIGTHAENDKIDVAKI